MFRILALLVWTSVTAVEAQTASAESWELCSGSADLQAADLRPRVLVTQNNERSLVFGPGDVVQSAIRCAGTPPPAVGERLCGDACEGCSCFQVSGQPTSRYDVPYRRLQELCVRGGEDGGQPKVLVVGLGLGEFLALAREACPTGVSIEVIEEYATVVEAARLYGALGDPTVARFTNVSMKSTEEFLERSRAAKRRFDLALVDCMSADGKIPYACRGSTFAHLLGSVALEAIQFADRYEDLNLLKEDYENLHDWYDIQPYFREDSLMLKATSATMRTFYGGATPNYGLLAPLFLAVAVGVIALVAVAYESLSSKMKNVRLKPQQRTAEQETLYTTLQEEGGIAMTSSAREPRFTAG